MTVKDFKFENHGTIWLATPTGIRANQWMRETAPEDAQFFGRALAIEPRYVGGFIDAAREAGFNV